MKNDVYDLPDSLYKFAQFKDFSQMLNDLAQMAEAEDWDYKTSASNSDHPILNNYINNTYKRLAVEKKIAYSKDSKYCCFDSGLTSRTQQEPIYLLFTVNTNPAVNCYWFFSKLMRKGEHDVNKFNKLPEMAFYWDDPAKLLYDCRKGLIVNVEHIITDNKDRFPAPYNMMSDYSLKNYLDGCITATKEKLKRNYKLAIPQYFIPTGTIQLLIPLCLVSPSVADLAIVVEDYGEMYRASTCLTLDMAINNARLIARPDRDWLNP